MSNIILDAMGKESEQKENSTYIIGEQGDLGGVFSALNDNDQKILNEQTEKDKK